MNKDRVFSLLKFVLFLGFIKSMNFYLFWYVNSVFFYFVIFLCLCFLLNIDKEYFVNKRKIVSLSILFFIGEIFAYDALDNIGKFVSCILYSFVASILFHVRNEYKVNILNYIIKYLSLVVALSLPLYFLIMICGYFPSLGSITYEDTASIYNYYNYIILLINDFYYYRFHSVFCEPGHLGMVIALLLYANKFQFKDKYSIFLLIGLVFTFSLAAYLLSFLGYFFMNIQKKGYLKKILPYLLVCFTIVAFIKEYNGGKNLLNELILERLAFDEDKGISGNNRVNWGATVAFAKLSLNDIVFGLGKKETEAMGASGPGFQVFIMEYGAVSYLMILLYYVVSCFSCSNKKYIFFYLVLFYLLLLQRSYPYWMTFVIIYAVIARNKENENSYNKLNFLA